MTTFCSSSAEMMFAGILPMTSYRVMLRLRAWSKYCFKNGFLTVRPVRSRVLRCLLIASESHRTIRLPSSVMSLFLAMSRN